MTQLDLLTYPHVPGSKTGGTSQEAAEAMKDRAESLERECLRRLRLAPMSTDFCAEVMGESVLSIRPRFSMLKAKGLIESTGERRKNKSGRSAMIWRART